MDDHSADLYLSAVSIAEIEADIAGLRRRRATRKADDLTAWLEALLYHDRILPLDVAVARIAGRLADQARGMGYAPGFADVTIAATAQHHGLTILTRNTRHFVPLGVPCHDPARALPPARSSCEPPPPKSGGFRLRLKAEPDCPLSSSSYNGPARPRLGL